MDFETHIQTAESAIATQLASANMEEANRLTYNLAADLAECWPDDDRPRTRAHFEKGVALAERCLAYRTQLQRGPRPFAIAHWVHGMHLLSLSRLTNDKSKLAAAIAAFERSVTSAVAAAATSGATPKLTADADYLVILNTGFLALARERAAPGTGQPLFDLACQCFRDQARLHPDRASDAAYGLKNLEVTAARLR